jgi:hypothetical protein
LWRKSTLIQHVTPVHVSSRIHTAESGKAGNVRAWSHSINKSRENLVRQAMLELDHILKINQERIW